MGVIRMRIRSYYTDVVDRVLNAVEKSEHLRIWHQTNTTPLLTIKENPSYPLYCVHYATKRVNADLIYVSAGIHGDEPAGVACATRLIELLADDDQQNFYPFPYDQYNWLISPCDNPYGYERDIRENALGLDLNRMFENPDRYPETKFIAASLRHRQCEYAQKRPNLALDLHEDSDSGGFYLWERRTSQSLPIGSAVVNNVEGLCAINRNPLIENHRNENGVITLLDKVTSKGWTRGRYLAEQVNTRCLILETPTRLPWETRIGVHLMAIQTAVKHAL